MNQGKDSRVDGQRCKGVGANVDRRKNNNRMQAEDDRPLFGSSQLYLADLPQAEPT
jgi:hypothetical protein